MPQRLSALLARRPAALLVHPSRAGARLAQAGIAAGVLGAALLAVVHLLNLAVFDLSVQMLNADVDAGVFMWASTGAAFVAGIALVGTGLLRPATRALTWGLALLVLLLSLDDLVGLHERLSALKTTLGPLDHASRLFWPLATMPLLALVTVGLWAVAAAAPEASGRAVRLGLGGLVLAVLLEMASPLLFALGFDHGDLGYELEVVLEEGLEQFGWTAIMAGLLALLVDVAVAHDGTASAQRDAS